MQLRDDTLAQLKKEIEDLKTEHKDKMSEFKKENSNLKTDISNIKDAASQQKESLTSITSKYDAQRHIIVEKEKLITSLEAQIKGTDS